MPIITDWIMVGITAAYVVATIFICRANIVSAKASKAQLDEMHRQYDDANRPNIEVELLYERKAFYGLRYINHGSVTANHVQIKLDTDFIDSIQEPKIAELLKKQVDKECIIGVGQHYDLFFGTNEYRKNPNKVSAKGYVIYEGKGQKYQSEFYVDLEHYATIFSTSNEQDDWKERMGILDKRLKGIENAIQELSNHSKENSEDEDLRAFISGSNEEEH